MAAAVAARLRPSATGRLDAIESAWATSHMLVAAPGGYSPLTESVRTPSATESASNPGAA